MAERDPFGRLPDENPLAGLGALSEGTTSQAAEPVVVTARDDWSGGEPAAHAEAAPPKPKPAAQQWGPPSGASARPAQQRPANPAIEQSLAEVIRQAQAMSGGKAVRSARLVGRVVRLVVLLVVLGVVFGVAKPLIDAAKDVGDSVSGIKTPEEIANDFAPPNSVGDEPGAKAPTGLSSSSMLVRRNFDRVVNRLSSSGLGHLRSLTVWPDRVTTELLTNGGSLRTVWISAADPKLDDHGTIGPGFSHLPTVRFSAIDTAAPARLARSAAGRARRPVTQVNYITLSAEQGGVVWRAYLKSGRIYVADAHGRITQRIS